MRMLLFVISLFSYLLSGGQTVMASNQNVVYAQEQHLNSAPTTCVELESWVTFIEDTDLDSVDENTLSKDNGSLGLEKTAPVSCFLHIPWLKAPPSEFLFVKYSGNYSFSARYNAEKSIYLKHCNLRI